MKKCSWLTTKGVFRSYRKEFCREEWKINYERSFKAQKWAVRVVLGLQDNTFLMGIFWEILILTFPCIYILNCLVFLKKHLSFFKNSLHESLIFRVPMSWQSLTKKHKLLKTQVYYGAIKKYNDFSLSLR